MAHFNLILKTKLLIHNKKFLYNPEILWNFCVHIVIFSHHLVSQQVPLDNMVVAQTSQELVNSSSIKELSESNIGQYVEVCLNTKQNNFTHVKKRDIGQRL